MSVSSLLKSDYHPIRRRKLFQDFPKGRQSLSEPLVPQPIGEQQALLLLSVVQDSAAIEDSEEAVGVAEPAELFLFNELINGMYDSCLKNYKNLQNRRS